MPDERLVEYSERWPEPLRRALPVSALDEHCAALVRELIADGSTELAHEIDVTGCLADAWIGFTNRADALARLRTALWWIDTALRRSST